MIQKNFILLLMVAWPQAKCSRQVTLTCGSGPDDDDFVRGYPGPPGKRGVAGPKGDVGEKGERGQNENNSIVISGLERKVTRLENQVTGLQRELREEKTKRRRNGNQVLQLRVQTAQIIDRLANLDGILSQVQNNISMIRVVDGNEMQDLNPSRDSSDRDCHDLNAAGVSRDGVYNVTIDGSIVPVYCDMEGSEGWTVFQKRSSTRENFNRNWAMYRRGFGNLNGSFWLGLEHIHQLTKNRNCKLRVDVWTSLTSKQYAVYRTFSIQGENDNYRLHVRGYSGTAGDGLIESAVPGTPHNNMLFTTKDRDNDNHRRNCATTNEGGWWFNACRKSCLNCKLGSIVWNFSRKMSSTMKLLCD